MKSRMKPARSEDRECTIRSQGARGGRKWETGDQFSELKEANTGGCHSLKTHLKQSDGIKNSGTRMEKRSKRHEEEQQPDRTSPRREGRGQEGPSSKKRLQAKRRQKEQGQEQGRATEREKHEAIARAQVYGIDEVGPAWKGSALNENAHSRITKTSHGQVGLQTKSARPNR